MCVHSERKGWGSLKHKEGLTDIRGAFQCELSPKY